MLGSGYSLGQDVIATRYQAIPLVRIAVTHLLESGRNPEPLSSALGRSHRISNSFTIPQC
jgi:hypothetical protein